MNSAKRSPRPVTRGESTPNQSARVDWLNATFKPGEMTVEGLIIKLSQIMRRPISGVDEGKGIRGYKSSVTLFAHVGSRKQPMGFIGFGGEAQRGTWMLSIPGAGCSLIEAWDEVRDLLEDLNARVTRLDLCVDFLNGEYTVEDAVAFYRAGKFTSSGRPPATSQAGDWLNERERTLYIGKAQNGKVLRAYEKGHQLGNLQSPWTRYEVQFGNRDRVIPLEALTERDKYFAGAYELTKRDLGNGHLEYSVRSLVTWEDHGDLTPEAMAYYHEARAANEEERKENSRRIAAIRAKKRVRHLCKAAGLNHMLTLTYQANVICRETTLKHLKEFNRRMMRLIPDWFYVAALERQKRGCWHVHMAIKRPPRKLASKVGVKVDSYRVVTAVWRSVVGALGGMAHHSTTKKNSQRAPSKIASYLSKYMIKAFEEGEPWSKRFSSSKGLPIPKPERIRFAGYDLGEVCGLIFEDLGTYDTHQLRCSLNYFKDGAWFILDRNIPPWTDAQWAVWADHHPESWLEAA